MTPDAGRAARTARLALLALLAIYGFAYLRDPGAGHLIDGIDLAIHETGHLVFAPFGEFVQFAGGTLFQLIVPGLFLAYFLRFAPRRDEFAAAVIVWWLAVNLWNIAVYAGDARTQELPLVGGGEHDWAYLLGRTGLLRHDAGVAGSFRAVGVLLYLAALAWGWRATMAPPPAGAVDGAAGAR